MWECQDGRYGNGKKKKVFLVVIGSKVENQSLVKSIRSGWRKSVIEFKWNVT